MIGEADQREIFQRLKSAQKRSQEAFEKTERGWDLHAGTQIANWWPFIAAGYSGIEQSFKFLIAVDKGITIKKLLDKKESPNYRTHNLRFLFEALDEETRRVLHEYYGRFRSLHNYIEIETLQDFLTTISGTSGKGYEEWRYSLIEPGQIPPNSVDCMLAIWNACVQLITKRQYSNQEIWMPERELLREFDRALNEAWRDRSFWHQIGHNRPTSVQVDMQKWREEDGHPINAYAQLIWSDYRGITPENAVNPDWLAKLLSVWLEKIKNLHEGSNQTSLSYFIERAKGNTRTGLGIRWDAEEKRFEDIPWNLDEIVSESVPNMAQRIEDGKDHMRNDLLQTIYGDGFEVRENGFRNQQIGDEAWMCTLMAEKEQTSGEKIIVEVWEQGWDKDLYVNVKNAHSEVITETQEWIQCRSVAPDEED